MYHGIFVKDTINIYLMCSTSGDIIFALYSVWRYKIFECLFHETNNASNSHDDGLSQYSNLYNGLTQQDAAECLPLLMD